MSAFTLAGDTRGGPPTTYIWTRDGVVIDNEGPFNISIALNGCGVMVNQESHYRSTLTVTGDLPGMYQYSVANRATSTPLTQSYNVTPGK